VKMRNGKLIADVPEGSLSHLTSDMGRRNSQTV
jgi:hypothetical protein